MDFFVSTEDFYLFGLKKGKCLKLYVRIHTIARSKERVSMSSEWYLDIFNITYFDVFTNFVDQRRNTWNFFSWSRFTEGVTRVLWLKSRVCGTTRYRVHVVVHCCGFRYTVLIPDQHSTYNSVINWSKEGVTWNVWDWIGRFSRGSNRTCVVHVYIHEGQD